MFDDYKRECPRCHTELHTQAAHCPSCRKLLPWKLSKTRRVVDTTVITIAVIAGVIGMLAPDLVRTLIGRRVEKAVAAVSVAPAWTYGGKPPAARAWAYRIEASLSSACSTTFQQYADKRYVQATLTQFLGAVEKDAGRPLTVETARLTEDEKKDAFAQLSDESRFVEKCLKVSYEAIKTCEQFKDELSSKAAGDCMVPAVRKALTTAPFQWCSVQAQMERVRGACAYAAQQAEQAAAAAATNEQH